MNVNRVILIGRVTKEVELRNTPSGSNVASLSMATNSFYTDKQKNRQEKTEFHEVVLWGKLAEIAHQYVEKGQEVYIEGRLETSNYEKDGIKKSRTKIIGETLQMGAKAKGSQTKSREESVPDIQI